MRTQQRDVTREQIVKAALQAIAESGFDGVSTRAIAARANVSQGLLSYHFKSKDALWRASADHLFALADEAITDALAHREFDDPREQCRQLIRQLVFFSAAHPEFVRFMVEQGKDDNERSRWLADTHLSPIYKRFSELPWDGPNVDFPHLFYSVAGAASFIFAVADECKLVTGKDPRANSMAERHANFLAELIVPS